MLQQKTRVKLKGILTNLMIEPYSYKRTYK